MSVRSTQASDRPEATALVPESAALAGGGGRLLTRLPGRQTWALAGGRIALGLAALGLFILALEMLKAGAGAVAPFLDQVSAEGGLNAFGFGWLAAYVLMSGSPVAAVSLTLFSGGVLSDSEAFAMMNGSRYGASFIILLVGFIYYLRRQRDPDALHRWAVALLITFCGLRARSSHSLIWGAGPLTKLVSSQPCSKRVGVLELLMQLVNFPLTSKGAEVMPGARFHQG